MSSRAASGELQPKYRLDKYTPFNNCFMDSCFPVVMTPVWHLPLGQDKSCFFLIRAKPQPNIHLEKERSLESFQPSTTHLGRKRKGNIKDFLLK